MSELDRIDRKLRDDVGTGVEPDPPLGGVIFASGASAVAHYEDVTTGELQAQWAAFLARPDVTRQADGSFTWTYTAADPDEPAE